MPESLTSPCWGLLMQISECNDLSNTCGWHTLNACMHEPKAVLAAHVKHGKWACRPYVQPLYTKTLSHLVPALVQRYMHDRSDSCSMRWAFSFSSSTRAFQEYFCMPASLPRGGCHCKCHN